MFGRVGSQGVAALLGRPVGYQTTCEGTFRGTETTSFWVRTSKGGRLEAWSGGGDAVSQYETPREGAWQVGDQVGVGACPGPENFVVTDTVTATGTVQSRAATGVYELLDAAEAGIVIVVGLVLLWAGYRVVARLVRSATPRDEMAAGELSARELEDELDMEVSWDEGWSDGEYMRRLDEVWDARRAVNEGLDERTKGRIERGLAVLRGNVEGWGRPGTWGDAVRGYHGSTQRIDVFDDRHSGEDGVYVTAWEEWALLMARRHVRSAQGSLDDDLYDAVGVFIHVVEIDSEVLWESLLNWDQRGVDGVVVPAEELRIVEVRMVPEGSMSVSRAVELQHEREMEEGDEDGAVQDQWRGS